MGNAKPKLAYRSRLIALLVVVAAVGAPAAALRALCVGRSCQKAENAASEVPFCSLPPDVRTAITHGFRKGRSPDVLAVAGATPVVGGATPTRRASPGGPLPIGFGPDWPSSRALESGRVPIGFYGKGVEGGADIPAGTGLDDIAPTLADAIELRRKFPEVRSGQAVPSAVRTEHPKLLVLVALKGIGSSDIQKHPGDWPELTKLMSAGAATLGGEVGSLPLDPAAGVTSIGTGGIPSQHGIVGSLVRNDNGVLVSAWGKRAPVSVIAALGDDLDDLLDEKPIIGVAGSEPSDRGLIGGNWYVDVDQDLESLRRNPASATEDLLRKGDFGGDAVPDLLGVAIDGTSKDPDRDLRKVVAAADHATHGDYLLGFAGTGAEPPPGTGVPARTLIPHIERSVPGPARLIEAAEPGGLFVDQDALIKTSQNEDVVVGALKDMKDGAGDRLFVDAFSAIAVSFARYC